jgi:cell division FtsZ-interacting protein ZapD
VEELLEAFASGADKVATARLVLSLGGVEAFAVVRRRLVTQGTLFKARKPRLQAWAHHRTRPHTTTTALTRHCRAPLQEQLAALHRLVKRQKKLEQKAAERR